MTQTRGDTGNIQIHGEIVIEGAGIEIDGRQRQGHGLAVTGIADQFLALFDQRPRDGMLKLALRQGQGQGEREVLPARRG